MHTILLKKYVMNFFFGGACSKGFNFSNKLTECIVSFEIHIVNFRYTFCIKFESFISSFVDRSGMHPNKIKFDGLHLDISFLISSFS